MPIYVETVEAWVGYAYYVLQYGARDVQQMAQVFLTAKMQRQCRGAEKLLVKAYKRR